MAFTFDQFKNATQQDFQSNPEMQNALAKLQYGQQGGDISSYLNPSLTDANRFNDIRNSALSSVTSNIDRVQGRYLENYVNWNDPRTQEAANNVRSQALGDLQEQQKRLGGYGFDTASIPQFDFYTKAFGTTPGGGMTSQQGVDLQKQAFQSGATQQNVFSSQNVPKTPINQTVQAPTGNLQPGQSGDQVSQLQKWLISQGQSIPSLQNGSAQYGFFGKETQAALANWQKQNNVATGGNEGFYGPQTMSAITGTLNTSPLSDTSKPVTGAVPLGGVGSPSLPTNTSLASNDSYYQTLSTQLADVTKRLDAMKTQQLTTIQNDKAQAQQALDSIRTSQKGVLDSMGQASMQEKQDKLDQLAIEQKRFDENYNTIQGLAGQLTDLNTQGQTLIAQQKGVTGLASIRDPRIAKTMSDVTAAAGVIQASISVYNGQMNQAQQQLQLATNTITSAYSDQISYYKSLATFYESTASDKNAQLTVLTSDEKQMIQSRIVDLANEKARVEANTEKLQNLFLDPDTALKFAKAGITINTPQSQWGTLLRKQSYAEEMSAQSKDMADKGYTALVGGKAPAGAEVVTQQDSMGNSKQYYKMSAKPVGTQVSSMTNAINEGRWGSDLLNTLPFSDRSTISSLLNYTKDPKNLSLRKSAGESQSERERMLSIAHAIDPSFDETQYGNRNKVRASFTSGADAKNINSLNTAIGHLASFAKSAKALDNAGWQTYNSLSNFLETTTGDPRVTNFETTKNAVASEMATIFKNTSGTDQEIKSWKETVNSSESPQQLQGAIDSMFELMSSRVSSLSSKYSEGMGKPADFNFLNQKSRDILTNLGYDPQNIDPQVSPSQSNNVDLTQFHTTSNGVDLTQFHK